MKHSCYGTSRSSVCNLIFTALGLLLNVLVLSGVLPECCIKAMTHGIFTVAGMLSKYSTTA